MGVEKLKSIEEEQILNGSDHSTAEPPKSGTEFKEGPKYGQVDENRMLEIMNRMNRVAMILKVCMDLRNALQRCV